MPKNRPGSRREQQTVTKDDVGAMPTGVARTDPKPSGALPGTKDPKAKKEKKEKIPRVDFPGLAKDDNGVTTTLLTEWPDAHNPKVHKPLRQRDFKDECIYMLRKADDFEAKAKRLRRDAEDFKKLGNRTDRQKAKRVIAMQRRLSELKEQLVAQGIDVDALLDADEDEDAEE